MNSKMVKTEDLEESETSKQDDHLHSFTVKFGSDHQKYDIDCTEPSTVLQVIKAQYEKELQDLKKKRNNTKENIGVSEETIIIKVGEGNDSPIVATHFPCCCVEENQCLTIMIMDSAAEKRQTELKGVLPKENYSVFFIDEELGEGHKYKRDMVFLCKNMPQNCKYFCVYGTKGMTVEEALQQDGRFVEGLTDFKLSDNENQNLKNHKGIVDKLDGKKFKMCKLPPKQLEGVKQNRTQQTNREEEKQEAKVSASTSGQNKSKMKSVLEHAAKKGVSLKKAMEELRQKNINHEEINDLLQKQFPGLKLWMESRSSNRSFEETLKLKHENFGKIQNSFSEVHTVSELLKLSESICLLMIKENNSKKTMQGTGFVLLDNFVLTNAHLFESSEETGNWWDYLTITAEFNFEIKDKPGREYQAKLVGRTHELDFALLELTKLPDQEEIPPGLLKMFGPIPGGDGGACIIGHPAGGVKKMDITCVIRKEQREQAVEQNLLSYEPFIVCSTNYQINRETYADIRVHYNSFMYHGSSGSPVFDAFGRVFGLHSGGFFYNKVIPGHSVMEYSYPLLDIFKKLLGDLQNSNKVDLLERIQVAAQGNPYLETILESVGLKQTNVQALCVENQGRTDETGEQLVSEEEMDQSWCSN